MIKQVNKLYSNTEYKDKHLSFILFTVKLPVVEKLEESKKKREKCIYAIE